MASNVCNEPTPVHSPGDPIPREAAMPTTGFEDPMVDIHNNPQETAPLDPPMGSDSSLSADGDDALQTSLQSQDKDGDVAVGLDPTVVSGVDKPRSALSPSPDSSETLGCHSPSGDASIVVSAGQIEKADTPVLPERDSSRHQSPAPSCARLSSVGPVPEPQIAAAPVPERSPSPMDKDIDDTVPESTGKTIVDTVPTESRPRPDFIQLANDPVPPHPGHLPVVIRKPITPVPDRPPPPTGKAIVDTIPRESRPRADPTKAANGQAPPHPRHHPVVIRIPLSTKGKRRASTDPSSRKRLKQSGSKKSTGRKRRQDMDVDDDEQTDEEETDVTNEQESEDGMDIDEEVDSHIPRLEVLGDKEVSHTITAQISY